MLREANEQDHRAGTIEPRSLKDQSSKVLEDVRELGSIAVENVGRTVERLQAKGRGAVGKGRERLARTNDEFHELIVSHPWKSLLVAIGVGAFLGVTMRRKCARATRDACVER